ncbi:TlpA family protein disulfide reductase [Flavobacteriaceae bacterium GSB9]|nr:TlpA family protein disulfide reductase [Flavobacteriaceae bacterium GSB9]
MKLKILSLSLLFLVSCFDGKKKNVGTFHEIHVVENHQKDVSLEVYDFSGLEKFLNKQDNKIHVINFWATWCAPCVKELPYFERLNKTYKGKGVEVLLVSLDFPHLYEKKLMPFIKENNFESRVVALDDPDMNTWIPKVSEKWTGAIPATIIYKNNEQRFYERSFNYEALELEVKQFLNL